MKLLDLISKLNSPLTLSFSGKKQQFASKSSIPESFMNHEIVSLVVLMIIAIMMASGCNGKAKKVALVYNEQAGACNRISQEWSKDMGNADRFDQLRNLTAQLKKFLEENAKVLKSLDGFDFGKQVKIVEKKHAALQKGTSARITVPGGSEWTNTGVTLEKGQHFFLGPKVVDTYLEWMIDGGGEDPSNYDSSSGENCYTRGMLLIRFKIYSGKKPEDKTNVHVVVMEGLD